MKHEHEKDHGGTSLTEGDAVSVLVHAGQLPHDEPEYAAERDDPRCQRCGGTGYDDHDCMEDICVCQVLFTGVCPDCRGEG